MVFLDKLEKVQKDLLLFDQLATLQDLYGIDVTEDRFYSREGRESLEKALELEMNGKCVFETKTIHKSYIEAMLYFLDTIGLIEKFKKI